MLSEDTTSVAAPEPAAPAVEPGDAVDGSAGPAAALSDAWIAEGIWRGRAEDEIVADLVASGHDAALVEQKTRALAAHPLQRAGRSFFERLSKLAWQVGVRRELARLHPDHGRIERRFGVSREEFLERYYSRNTPVILTDLQKDWRARTLWSPAYFKEKYGDVMVDVTLERTADPDYDINAARLTRPERFADFVDRIDRASGTETNDFYLISRNRALERPELRPLLDDLRPFPEYVNPEACEGGVCLWVGPGGTVTPLHHDPTNNLFAQVYGRKRFKLISPLETALLADSYYLWYSRVDCERPDLEQHPYFADLPVIDVVLEPGEFLFIPVSWWHHVRSLEPSISLSFVDFDFPNEYPWR